VEEVDKVYDVIKAAGFFNWLVVLPEQAFY